jgi:hypothetical protein
MNAMHDHHHGVRDRRLLALALGLILVFMVAEVVFGLLADSLALLADAGHMLTDAAALGLAFFAAWAASLPARGRFTFGFARAEILAAQINGITLVLIALWILYEAIRRLIDPLEVQAGVVTVVALAGIVVNLAVVWILSRARRQSLNVRGAYLHITTDLAAFAGTAVAGVLILLTGWDRFDPIASLIVVGLMLYGERRAPSGVGPHLPRGRADVRAAGGGGRSARELPRCGRGARSPRLDGHERLSIPVGACARRARSRLPSHPARARAPAARALRDRSLDSPGRARRRRQRPRDPSPELVRSAQ